MTTPPLPHGLGPRPQVTADRRDCLFAGGLVVVIAVIIMAFGQQAMRGLKRFVGLEY